MAPSISGPVNLGRYHLPAGADLIFSCYAQHRDPSLYPSPLTFDPDRWLPERTQDHARHVFMPSGAGKHHCIGESFAWTAMTLSAATIAGRWRLQQVPGRSVREKAQLVIHPGHLLMTAHPRTRVAESPVTLGG